ncbi:MAG: hypothetical protein JNL88_12195 [Bacteroidia bacterium]|nr:hypothetical protein [Bacteroidia bacterium]
MKRLMPFLFILICGGPLHAQTDSLFTVFNVQQSDNKIILFFTVRGGIQCSGVRIQRSGDGILFEDVYEFPGVCGSPSSDESYLWHDPSPLRNRLNYYRLEVGSLGLFSELKTVYFYDFQSGQLFVQTNPCSDCLIRFPNERAEACEISFFSADGKELAVFVTRDERMQLTTPQNMKGLTFIRVLYPGGTVLRGKILME